MCRCPWMDGGVGILGDTAAGVTRAPVIAQITSLIHQELLGWNHFLGLFLSSLPRMTRNTFLPQED